METISAEDAWLIADDNTENEEFSIDRELKPTNSARRIKALVEQVTGPCCSLHLVTIFYLQNGRPLFATTTVHPSDTVPHHRSTTFARVLPRPDIIFPRCIRNPLVVSHAGSPWCIKH